MIPAQTYFLEKTNSCRGVLVKRIPFTNPSDLYRILQILRRQITFNELFRSCFNAESLALPNRSARHTSAAAADASTAPDLAIELFVEKTNRLAVSFPSRSGGFVSLSIAIKDGGLEANCRVAQLSASHTADLPISNAFVTELLKASLNLPLTIAHVLDRLENPAKTRTPIVVESRAQSGKQDKRKRSK